MMLFPFIKTLGSGYRSASRPSYLKTYSSDVYNATVTHNDVQWTAVQ